MLADCLAPQVRKAKNGTRMRLGHSAKSFAMLWSFETPIGVSECNDTACSVPSAASTLSYA